MSKELVISSSSHETRVAILEDDQLVEIYFQRANEYSLAGSIHKGRVTRVLPGMQSAFVDLGLERDTFLYVSDFFEEDGEEIDRVETKPIRGEQSYTVPRPEPAVVPPVIEEPVAVEEVEPADSEQAGLAAADSAGESSTEQVGGGNQRDRNKGRRGRRRRTRAKGFPDSKYASDLTSSPSSEDTAAALDDEIEPAPEVILLPGESLAKYRRGSQEEGDASEPEPLDLQPDDPDAPVAEDIDEALDEPASEEEPEGTQTLAARNEALQSVDADDSLTSDDEPELKQHMIVAEELGVEAYDRLDFAQPDASLEPGEATETSSDEAPIPEGEELPETLEAAAAAAVDTGAVEEETGEEDPDQDSASDEAADEDTTSGNAVQQDETGAPVGETANTSEQPASGEPGVDQPLQASVREQNNNRYQHRSSRRMRRRGRGGDRNVTERVPGERSVSERGAADRTSIDRGPMDRKQRQPAVEVEDRKPSLPSITDLLKEGQEIIVQIAKEPLGQKGARITSHIALPGRYVVYMPTLEHLGVSRKIASDEERLRLKRILQTHRQGIMGGFIVRTAGEGHTEEEIAADMSYLSNLWLDIRSKSEKKPAPALLHHDLDIVQRILRDQLSDMYKTIWVDNEDVYESTLRFLQRFQPALVNRVKMYTRSTPIFDAFSVTQEIEKALRPKVWLKSGGYIVINQTEALVAIDVNTGKYVGKSNRLEDTITKTNTEAVKEIVRQVRLRDLGGIIVVDFIDMDERKNRQKVMQALEEAMRADRAPYKILQFNDFGLVAITRKRVKQSLERSLCTPCPVCEGAGYTKSVTTVVTEILQEATKMRQMADGKNVVLRTHPEVAKFLKSNSNDYLEELESIVGRPVLVKSDPLLHPEKFDLAL
jgi:ribonuclease G